MKVKSFYLLIGVSVVLLSGCAGTTMPTRAERKNIDYGAPLSIDYESSIKNYFDKSLFDPYSAHYSFSSPETCCLKEGLLSGGRQYVGYLVVVGVNAKNRMGAYVGMQEYGFLFKNNRLVKVLKSGQLQYFGIR